MTAAAGMIALQDLPEGPQIPPALMLNLDASAGSVAQKYGGGVLITEEVKKEPRKQVQSTTGTKNKEKDRYAHYMPVSSATGEVACFIAMILDRALTEPTILTVSGKTSLKILTRLVG